MHIVKEENTLLEYILKYIEPNRKKAKNLLSNKSILINNKNNWAKSTFRSFYVA